MKPLRLRTLATPAVFWTLAAHVVSPFSFADSVTTLTTKGDQSVLLELKQEELVFHENLIESTNLIEIDPSISYQTIAGMGYTLTDASAAAILELPEEQQTALLNEIYHPVTGMRSSVVRIAIGASDLATELFTFSDEIRSGNNFVPDPDKSYYIDNPAHDVRLGASGDSEDPYTAVNSPSGADYEWRFVPAGDGLYFIDRAAGGLKPRMRTDDSNMADMQETTSDGWWEKWQLTPGETHGSYFLSLPLKGPGNHDRLQIDDNLLVRMVDNDRSAGTWESFIFTEVGSDKSFSLAGPEMDHRIPVLKKILTINPDVKILATPWTAPLWMKSNNDWVGGRLKPEHYGDLAQYFVDYIAAMKTEGINIWAITPQNEPENPWNEPSMLMSAEEQLRLIDQFIGPALETAGFADVKILSFDHNLDNIDFPIHVAQSNYVDGSAFHLYAGDIADMSTVHNATGKDVYFTEQFTGKPEQDTEEAWAAAFDLDFWVHTQWVVMGSLRNHSRTVMQWNLITSEPTTPTGCVVCLGAYTLDNGTIQRNVGVYNIAQLASMLEPGAKRIKSTPFVEEASLINVALQNPDGSIVAMVYNKLEDTTQTITLAIGRHAFDYPIGPRTAVTFRWYPDWEVTDRDLDGVADSNDQCPDTKVDEPVDASGCSVLDDDDDGVRNQADACPNTPKDVEVDSRGCQKSVPSELSCTVNISNNWGSGGQLDVRISNNSNQTVTDWQVGIVLADGLQLANSWNATLISTLPLVFTSDDWNKQIASGQSIDFGMQVNGSLDLTPDCSARTEGLDLRDDDQDGIINSQDQCPNTPLGANIDERGCAVETASCEGVAEYPNWLHADWEGGENTHLLAGDLMRFNEELYQANWHTSSKPGSDASWTHIGHCP